MCQQTRVDTAIPYFERFLVRWPTLEDFAQATEDEVVAAWAGLGYYRRARNLHRAAHLAWEGGGLPSTVEGLLALPGVGPYTAGAIASIAFGVPAAAVDGNVERVVSRLDALTDDPKAGPGRRKIHARVEGFHDVHAGYPGDLTQALMELGATVCTPKKPRCGTCPWGQACVARAQGEPERYPQGKKRPKPTPTHGVCGVVVAGGRVLAAQRSGEGLLGGLWEPVMGQVDEGEVGLGELARVMRERSGVDLKSWKKMGSVTHVFSHRRLTCAVYLARVDSPPSVTLGEGYQALRWVADLGEVAWSTLGKKLLERAETARHIGGTTSPDGPVTGT
jgi:A/G-specific adenine glycosylase